MTTKTVIMLFVGLLVAWVVALLLIYWFNSPSQSIGNSLLKFPELI